MLDPKLEDDETSSEARREQSSISFPYLDLDTAIEVAQAVYNRGGLGACSLDELAAEMDQVIGGSFRVKVSTSRIFELIMKDGRNSLKLTDLGRRIVDHEFEIESRAEAFLRVPLYAKVFELYRGQRLPPSRALEKEMQTFGVPSKQTDKARQAFERSARQAGYFASGEDRLVRPRVEIPVSQTNASTSPTEPIKQSNETPSARLPLASGSNGNLHPFIQGLLGTLPEPDTEWKVVDRIKWLQTAASIFGLIYKGDGSLTVTVTNNEAG